MKVSCDAGTEFKGRFQALCESLGIRIPKNAPSSGKETPSLNADLAPSSVLRAASCWRHHPSCGVKPSKQQCIPLGGLAPHCGMGRQATRKLMHMHEWGTLKFKHIGERFRPTKLAAKAQKVHLVGYNRENKTYRLLRDPAEPLKITNPAQVSSPFGAWHIKYHFARRTRVMCQVPKVMVLQRSW